MAEPLFHPSVARWFEKTHGAPTPAQREAWPPIQAGEHVLIAAPTGSGKTLAAFLSAIDSLAREHARCGSLPDETRVLYVSPLKALSHDIDTNLAHPLAGIFPGVVSPIRTWVRTGDTPQRERSQATKRPPHVVVTTPESLYLLLTSDGGRRMLGTVRTLIVDEIHALVRDKRGSHLALSLERLAALVRERDPAARVQRIGLSATQKPIDEVAGFLVGDESGGTPGVSRRPAHIVDVGHRRDLDLALELPGSPLEAVMGAEVWDEIYARLVTLIETHRTTLVFVNTRRAAERIAKQLSERLGEAHVTSHHGSMAREKRHDAEQRLKRGELRALVATASLELGIDIGDVDLVCQLGSPRSIATFLQRVGRSGHQLRGTPRGRLFPLSRDDLVECAALLDAVRRGELDVLHMPLAPLDVLAQQIVATLATGDLSADALFALVRRAYPYRALARADFDAVVQMLAEGFETRRGRRAALVHHDAVHGQLRARRAARLTAITSGGAIPDNFDYEVLLEPENLRVGSVNEDFAIESMAGDVFQLGNASYRIRRVEAGVVRVEDAKGQPPSLPFWLGEAPGRTEELSCAVSRLRTDVDGWLGAGLEAAVARAAEALSLGAGASRQLIEYLGAARAVLGAMPCAETLLLERFFDETGSMHLVLHAPLGSRLNRAFGLALRKRFCRSFNVELQAAANDDAVVLSLGPNHSFALDDVYRFVRCANVRDVLTQALLDAPVFNVRWRWNASRALAIPRFQGGKKVPPRFQRMLADDLLAVSFPDQVACAENLTGAREVPDHPLVRQTLHDCLHEAMDLDGLTGLLGRIENGQVACLTRDLTEPSPLAQEILHARPYAFLDDAPLEERRTQAVIQRRWVDPARATDLSALDPRAIERVVEDAAPDARDADELHDCLLVHACLREGIGRERHCAGFFDALCDAGRAAVLSIDDVRLWIPAERVGVWALVHPAARLAPQIAQPATVRATVETRDQAVREVVRGRLEATGPTTVREVSRSLGLADGDTLAALHALEAEGIVLRGRFRASETEVEWCERRLLARIHRATLERLRSEIEPVSPAVMMRFLLAFQHATPATQLRGPEGLLEVVTQLQGFELSAGAWERDVLPRRVASYDPAALDMLCWTGRVGWARSVRDHGTRASAPIRTTPIALFLREHMGALRAGAAVEHADLSRHGVGVRAFLGQHGASFVHDIARGTGLLQAQVDGALAELVAHGLVSADGFAGLRALFSGQVTRSHPRHGRARAQLLASAGRYSLLPVAGEPDVATVARMLLQRWGVVFRKLVEREPRRQPWGELLREFRRMEARGEVRGGRFVAGFSGEQYALPDATGLLRQQRREEPRGELVSLSGSDPLNLVGVIAPGARLPAVAAARLVLRDGVPVAVLAGGQCRFLTEPDPGQAFAIEAALRREAAVGPARGRAVRPQPNAG